MRINSGKHGLIHLRSDGIKCLFTRENLIRINSGKRGLIHLRSDGIKLIRINLLRLRSKWIKLIRINIPCERKTTLNTSNVILQVS